jgi:uncharacterized protein YwgA
MELLRRLLERGIRALPWCGSLAIQKLVYLLQSVFGVQLGYPYGLHHLGPYSAELANELSLGEQMGLWHSWEQTYQGPSGQGWGRRYDVRQPDMLSPVLQAEAGRLWTGIEPRVEMAIRRLAGFQGRQLELIATIHYLRHVQNVSEDQLVEVLRTLKPKFSEEEIRRGERTLAELDSAARAA